MLLDNIETSQSLKDFLKEIYNLKSVFFMTYWPEINKIKIINKDDSYFSNQDLNIIGTNNNRNQLMLEVFIDDIASTCYSFTIEESENSKDELKKGLLRLLKVMLAEYIEINKSYISQIKHMNSGKTHDFFMKEFERLELNSNYKAMSLISTVYKTIKDM